MNALGLKRRRLIGQYIAPYIGDTKIVAAMHSVQRHLFVPPAQRKRAYVNEALPIGYGQTISQPSLVAQMTEALQLDKTKSVLEIGTGSGYQAAVIALLSKQITTIEHIPELADRAKRLLQKLKYNNVQVVTGDGKEGYPDNAPYDAIIVTAGTVKLPSALVTQLHEGGIMVIPFGSSMDDLALNVGVKNGGAMHWQTHGWVSFVPLR